ncbi:MAG: beta-ketoacyl synthase chain length factor [Jatrophihabitantaceae bacterium]
MRTVSPPVVLAEYRWPTGQDEPLPMLPGYILSSFSPLVAAVADGCLEQHYGQPSASAASRQRTAVLLVSRGNDEVSADHLRDKVAAGRRVGPLFFFQTAPNSVVGQVTAHWGLGGPVVCISPVGDPLTDAMAEAAQLLDDGDADEVLLILVEQGNGDAPDTSDRAHALLLAAGTAQAAGAGP